MPLQFTENPQRNRSISFSSTSRVIAMTPGTREATQAEAEAGTTSGKYMSPLRVAQYVDNWVSDGGAHTDLVLEGSIRERLTATRTYYVRTDGSDSNTGLLNTSGGAFLTIQRAYDVIQRTLDLNGNICVIRVADGTYTGGLVAHSPLLGGGAVQLYIIGNTTTPSNVVIDVTSANAIQVGGGGYVQLQGVRLKTTTIGSCIYAYENGQVDFQNIDFGACASMHVEAQQHGRAYALADYTISGGAVGHLHCANLGFYAMTNTVCTVSNTPAFSAFFAGCSNANIACYFSSISGSATGQRFLNHNQGVIDVNGGGVNYFPGDIVGINDAATYAVYA